MAEAAPGLAAERVLPALSRLGRQLGLPVAFAPATRADRLRDTKWRGKPCVFVVVVVAVLLVVVLL